MELLIVFIRNDNIEAYMRYVRLQIVPSNFLRLVAKQCSSEMTIRKKD